MRIDVRLLDGFTVSIDGMRVPPEQWTRRGAARLVKLLAVSPGARLHRDRVLEALWPEVTPDVAQTRLHKAAHYARRSLGFPEAVVLKDEVVALFPGAAFHVDVVIFEATARAALTAEPVSRQDCMTALGLSGELLPEDLDVAWFGGPRERVKLLVEQLLRGARRWEDLLKVAPADEEAHVELIRDAVNSGDRVTALRRYAQMERTLEEWIGISPGPEARILRERALTSGVDESGSRPVAEPAAGGLSRTRTMLLERESELALLHNLVRSAVDGPWGRGADLR